MSGVAASHFAVHHDDARILIAKPRVVCVSGSFGLVTEWVDRRRTQFGFADHASVLAFALHLARTYPTLRPEPGYRWERVEGFGLAQVAVS